MKKAIYGLKVEYIMAESRKFPATISKIFT